MVIEAGRVSAFEEPERLVTASSYYRNALAVAGMSTTGAGSGNLID
jgi:hypothetical protein